MKTNKTTIRIPFSQAATLMLNAGAIKMIDEAIPRCAKSIHLEESMGHGWHYLQVIWGCNVNYYRDLYEHLNPFVTLDKKTGILTFEGTWNKPKIQLLNGGFTNKELELAPS